MAEAVKVRNEEAPERDSGAMGRMPEPVKRMVDYPRRFREFLHEVRVELKNVNWPTRDDVKSTTAVVIITVFVFGLFLFVVDYGVSHAVQRVLNLFKP